MKQHRKSHKVWLRLSLTAAALVALNTQAFAGGLKLYEIGSADVGLAAAGYAARAQDASTVLTNPAGMVRLEGTQTMAGAQLLYGDVNLSLSRTANTASGGEGGNAIGWLPGASAFVSYSYAPDLKVGFGIGGNFGLAEKYDSDWAGRYYGKEAVLLGISLLPSVAYRVNDRLSLGATLNAMYGISKTEVAVNNVLPGFPDGELKLDDKVWGWGVNLGLLYQLNENTRFGLTYTSQVDLDFNPSAEFSSLAPGLNSALANRRLLNAELELGIKVPQGVMASFFHQVDPRWAILGNVGWEQWSKFGKIDVGVENNDIKETDLHFDDTWHAALGAQYRASDALTYNFGIAYDSHFQDGGDVSPLLPGNRAWRFGIGVQNQVDKVLSWGVAAEYVDGGTLDTNKRSVLPVALGGRGDLIGFYRDTRLVFLSAHANWKF
jgi:long-chain fatty acid transport protein